MSPLERSTAYASEEEAAMIRRLRRSGMNVRQVALEMHRAPNFVSGVMNGTVEIVGERPRLGGFVGFMAERMRASGGAA